jgi:hypothetical protein
MRHIYGVQETKEADVCNDSLKGVKVGCAIKFKVDQNQFDYKAR